MLARLVTIFGFVMQANDLELRKASTKKVVCFYSLPTPFSNSSNCESFPGTVTSRAR